MSIHFFNHQVQARLAAKKALSDFLTLKAKSFLPKVDSIDLTYIFCTDNFLLEKNIAFLNHNTLTDILTFDLSEMETELSAEIYISIERIRENATAFKVGYNEELHRVIFHGLLHLCGFKDKSEEERKEMRQQEQNCLNQYLFKTI